MFHSTVTKKGQTTLPSQVRRALNLKAGDKLIYELEDGAVRVRLDPGTRSLLGALPSNRGKGMSFQQIRERAANKWASRARKRGSAA